MNSAASVHGRDLAGRRDADRPRAGRARAGAGGAQLHGNPDRDHAGASGSLRARSRSSASSAPLRRWPSGARRRTRRFPLERYFAGVLERGLAVEPSRGSNVINLTFSGPDPLFAQAAANAFAQAYMDVSVELRVAPARQSATFLDEQTKVLRANLEQAQAKLSKFQQTKGIVVSDERLDQENARYLVAHLATRGGPGRASRDLDPPAQHRWRVLARRLAEQQHSRPQEPDRHQPRPSSPRSAASSARIIRRAWRSRRRSASSSGSLPPRRGASPAEHR